MNRDEYLNRCARGRWSTAKCAVAYSRIQAAHNRKCKPIVPVLAFSIVGTAGGVFGLVPAPWGLVAVCAFGAVGLWEAVTGHCRKGARARQLAESYGELMDRWLVLEETLLLEKEAGADDGGSTVQEGDFDELNAAARALAVRASRWKLMRESADHDPDA